MSKEIPVRAIRQGYFNNQIKPEGAKFSVNKVEELGSWMERLDGGVNPAENKHLISINAVKNKNFKILDSSKIADEKTLQKKAEKEVAASHKDAPSSKDVEADYEEVKEVALTPAQKAAATRAKNAAAKKNTQGLI